jgi:hypothetical protein
MQLLVLAHSISAVVWFGVVLVEWFRESKLQF